MVQKKLIKNLNIFSLTSIERFIYLGFYVAFNTVHRSYHEGGSFVVRGNPVHTVGVKVLYSKLLTIGKQLPAFSLEVGQGIKL